MHFNSSVRPLLGNMLRLSVLLTLNACDSNNDPEDVDMTPVDSTQDVRGDADMSAEADLGAPDLGPIPDDPFVFEIANGCHAIRAVEPDADLTTSGRYLGVSGEGFSFSKTSVEDASALRWRASDLGTYLLYDEQARYVLVKDADAERDAQAPFERKETILSDILTVNDDYLPGAQWVLHASPRIDGAYHLRHLKSDRYMTTSGLGGGLNTAAVLFLEPKQGCADYPELTLDASGTVRATPYDDGSVYGIVETHSHILSNFGFGGGGIFHGSAFHPFGVEHALPSCELFHGEDGRKDLFGFGFDEGGDLDQTVLLQSLIDSRTPEFNHFTDGYPTFTDVAKRPLLLHAPDAVLPLDRARVHGRPAPDGPARHEQQGHLRSDRWRGHAAHAL